MSTPKHTPGPWEVTGPHSREVITANPGTYKPCMTIAKVGGYWDEEAQANAALIAAAPAMYEALLLAVQALEELAQHPAFEGEAEEFNAGGYGYSALNKAQTALAQAEGNE